MRSEHLVWFLAAFAAIHLLLIGFLPAGATGSAVANLDAVQVQLLIDSYKDQLNFFKIASGTVVAAQTSAIVWLAKRLLDELSKKKK